MPYLTKEKTAEFFTKFGASATNTGSIEAQIALLTERINRISDHLQENKKDFSTHRGLMQLVGKRKRLLTYLNNNDLQNYRQLIEKIGLTPTPNPALRSRGPARRCTPGSKSA